MNFTAFGLEETLRRMNSSWRLGIAQDVQQDWQGAAVARSDQFACEATTPLIVSFCRQLVAQSGNHFVAMAGQNSSDFIPALRICSMPCLTMIKSAP